MDHQLAASTASLLRSIDDKLKEMRNGVRTLIAIAQEQMWKVALRSQRLLQGEVVNHVQRVYHPARSCW
jgi:hypothetical protein